VLTMMLGDDDRLQLEVGLGDQPRQADHVPVDLGDPEVLSADLAEMFVKSPTGITAADLRRVEDVAVPLGQLHPEFPARLQIPGLVASNPRH
jgi:hypothetical protein